MLLLSVLALALAGSAAAVADAVPPHNMIEKRVSLRTHSLHMPYVDSDLQNRWWDFGGDAIINTNKHVRLTQDKPSQKGWLWSRMPISMNNWQMDVEFKVDGKASSLYGDGFAIWVTAGRNKEGSVFGSADFFSGLGIFFDTYSNARHKYSFPRVTAMRGDGKTQYDHAGDNEKTELAACSDYFRRRDFPTKARLTYVKGHGISLQLATQNADIYKPCFTADIELPPNPYIGFSAETGDVSDAHDIVNVNTFSATLWSQYRNDGDKQQPLAAGKTKGTKLGREGASPGRKPQSSGPGGIAGALLFMLKIIGVLAFIAFAIAAYRTWAAEQSRRRAFY